MGSRDTVKVGVALPHYGDDVSVEGVVELARSCERLGYDSVWVSDHLTFDYGKYGRSDDLVGTLEPLTTLAVLARETERVRIGTMVLNNELRHPVVLAKAAATIHQASGGRLELGIGAGWYEREFALSGMEFPRTGARLERLAESVEILKGLLDGGRVDFAGKHYRVSGLVTLPVQRPRPTIWVGAKGDRSVGIAGRVGDGWNAAHFDDPQRLAERAAHLGDAKVRRSVITYNSAPAREMTERLKAFEELDVEHAVMCFGSVPFGLDDPDDVARFAADVLPHVR